MSLCIPVCNAQTTPAFTMNQTISDGAQRTTLAFDGLAMVTGNLDSQSFFPPGKVADYTGFQYLRDNDPSNMGHNTSFLTRIANNVIFILTDAQLAQLKTLATAQMTQVSLYGYKRFVLMQAFRDLINSDLPANTTGLSKAAVKQASHELYLIDGQISFERAMLYSTILNSLTSAQKIYLDGMKGKGFSSWPNITNDQIKTKMQGLAQGTGVAVMTYASDLFSWYAGSLTADVYFCPERHGTYYGGFYIKDAPAVGQEGYSISEQLTATAGAALCESSKGYVTANQAAEISSLVDIQRANLYSGTPNIVSIRTQIATLLRSLRVSTAASASVKTQVLALSGTYGDLDGENNYYYATVFARVYSTLTDTQKTKLAALRTSIMSGTYANGTKFNFSTCTTPFLYSEVITNASLLTPYIDAADGLFGLAPQTIADWRKKIFGVSTSAGIAADDNDPDKDGVTNAQEYLFGTNPLAFDSAAGNTLANSSDGKSLIFVAKQAAGAGYTGLARHYTVQTCDKTASTPWTDLSGYTDIVGANQTVSIPRPVNKNIGFQLKVWLE